MSEELPRNVIKKGRKEEPFSAEKIEKSIKFALKQTKGLPDGLIEGLTKYFFKKTLDLLKRYPIKGYHQEVESKTISMIP